MSMRRFKRSESERPITLTRPRRRAPLVLTTAAMLTVLVTTAILVPQWIRSQQFSATGVPLAQGDEGMQQLIDAQVSYRDAQGEFAPMLGQLQAVGGFDPQDYLRYRMLTNVDGSAVLLGSVGFTGDYSAALHDGRSLVGAGTGPTFLAAAEGAGWDSEWASERGFTVLPDVERSFGSMSVTGSTVTKVVLDEGSGLFELTVTDVPTTGSGATWSDAVIAAGGDPTLFSVDEARLGDERTAVDASDGSATVSLVAGDAVVRARVDWTPKTTLSGGNALELLARAGLPDGDVPRVDGVLVCATAASTDGIDSATVCHNVQGGGWAYASTGSATANEQLEVALGAVGATPSWAEERGLTLPTFEDLF